jgi:hypothetical protein
MKESSSKTLADFDITIDDNNNIRILPADKYAASEKLKGESTKFVSSINFLIRNYSIQWAYQVTK